MKPRMSTKGHEFPERGSATRSRWGEATDEPAREDARPTERRAEDCPPFLHSCGFVFISD